MDSGAASFEEAGHAAAGRAGLDQLDLRVAGRQEGYDGFLVGDVLDVGDFEAETVAPEAEGGRDIVDDDGNVIDADNMAHRVLRAPSRSRSGVRDEISVLGRLLRRAEQELGASRNDEVLLATGTTDH